MSTRHAARRRLALVAPAAFIALTGCGILAPEYAAFDLPPEEQTYTFEADQNGVKTTWEFVSSEVAVDDTPKDFICSEQMHRLHGAAEPAPPCRAEPLIFLRYEGGVDLNNSVPAPGAHRFTVHVTRQADDAPAIEGLRLWTSVDSGATWKEAQVRPVGGGAGGEQDYSALAVYPPVNRTDGSVYLKAEAWDAEGNRVEQVVDSAFALRSRD